MHLVDGGREETWLRLAYQLARCLPEIMLSKRAAFENSGKFNSKSSNIQSVKGQERQMLSRSLHSKLSTPFQAHSRLRWPIMTSVVILTLAMTSGSLSAQLSRKFPVHNRPAGQTHVGLRVYTCSSQALHPALRASA